MFLILQVTAFQATSVKDCMQIYFILDYVPTHRILLS